MKVSELIKELQALPQELEVYSVIEVNKSYRVNTVKTCHYVYGYISEIEQEQDGTERVVVIDAT